MTWTQTLIRVRAGQRIDPYSKQPEPDWDNPSLLRLRSCDVQPAGGTETEGRQDQVTHLYVVRAPGRPDVRATDRIHWQDQTFTVQGPPQRWREGIPHTVFTLERVSG